MRQKYYKQKQIADAASVKKIDETVDNIVTEFPILPNEKYVTDMTKRVLSYTLIYARK